MGGKENWPVVYAEDITHRPWGVFTSWGMGPKRLRLKDDSGTPKRAAVFHWKRPA